jgi:N-sulfoglucosamine sulfohydrolase
MLRLLLLIALFASVCDDLVAAPRNVVLFVTDDQGQDAGCYGNTVLKTPHLDALAADGTRFENAYCTTASCSPSRSVILTGLYNHANGQYGLEHGYNHFRSLENLKTLPVLLSDAGYRTARIGKFHVAPTRTYRFDEVLSANPRSAVEMAEACRPVIEAQSDQPFFLYFCTSDPHRGGAAKDLPNQPDTFGNKPQGESYPGVEPLHYDPNSIVVPTFLPDSPTVRAELAQYYESISRADAGLGRLIEILKAAGRYDDTLIICISDNGHPFPGAKTTVYEPGIKLPCIVRNPSTAKRGVVSEAFVNWTDIAPTILEFAGVKLPARVKMHGRSCLPVLDQEAPEGWDETYASHTFHEITMYYPMRVVRSGQYKLIWNIAYTLPFPFANDLWNSPTWQETRRQGAEFLYGQRTVLQYVVRPRFELYDLANDPDETQNLANDIQYRAVMSQLQRKLQDFQKRTGDPWVLKWNRE